MKISSLEQAQDPSTAPNVLSRLAKEAELRAAVAANPNTSFEDLLRLALAYPREVAGNVGFMLSMMVEPEKLDELTRTPKTLAALCRVAGVPEAVLEVAMRSDDSTLRPSLLVNPDLPAEYVSRIAKDRRHSTHLPALYHRNYPDNPEFSVEGVREEILRYGAVSDQALSLVSQGFVTDPKVLAVLADSALEKVRVAVAGSEHAGDLLVRLSRDADEGVRVAVAANRFTPEEVLNSLVWDGSVAVQQAVAGNLSTSPEALELLCDSADVMVRELVAGHPNATESVLGTLGRDPRENVCAAVAGNPGAPKETLLELSEMESEEVLNRLASNPRAPAAALREVAYRGDEEALFLLLSRRSVFKSVMEEVEVRLLGPLAGRPRMLLTAFTEHPSAPEGALWFLAEHEQQYGLAASIAHNPSAPEELLLWLAEHGGYTTREALLMRPDLPESVIVVLAEDPDVEIRLAAEHAFHEEPLNRNPYLGTDLQQFGVTSADDLRVRGEGQDDGAALQALRRAQASSPGPLGAYLIITHPSFGEVADWTRVELSADWFMRFSAALSPAAPEEVVQRLKGDADVRVAAAAEQRLA